MRGTTLEEEIAKHNADTERRIPSGYPHPNITEEERTARQKAAKHRALDKAKPSALRYVL